MGSPTISILGFLQKWTLLAGLPLGMVSEIRNSKYPYYFLYVLFGDIFLYGLTIRIHWVLSVEVMTGTVYEGQICIKLVYLFMVLRRFKNYIQMNDALLTEHNYILNIDSFQKLWEEKYKKSKGIYKKLLTGNTIIAFMIVLPMYLLGKGETALPGAHPLYHSFPLAPVLYLFMDLIGAGFTLVRSCCIDMVLVTLIIFHKTQLEYLKGSLEVVFEEVKKHPKSEEAKEVARKWIKTHQSVLSIIQEFKALVQPLLFINYLISLIDVVVAFWTFGAGDTFKLNVKISALCAHIFNFVTLGWQCSLLDSLEIQVVEICLLHQSLYNPRRRKHPRPVNDSKYLSHVFFLQRFLRVQHESMIRHMDYGQVLESPRWIRSFYLMTCMRCRIPIKITAMGFTQLSAPVFVQVVRNCLSLLMTVYQLQNRT